jgi:dihydroorotase-like cyclic amidohydrolase
MTSLVIKGGTVVDGTGSERFAADVLVEDGRILAIGTASSLQGSLTFILTTTRRCFGIRRSLPPVSTE